MKNTMTASERLIDYIMNLTPEQVDKVLAHLPYIQMAVKEVA